MVNNSAASEPIYSYLGEIAGVLFFQALEVRLGENIVVGLIKFKFALEDGLYLLTTSYKVDFDLTTARVILVALSS